MKMTDESNSLHIVQTRLRTRIERNGLGILNISYDKVGFILPFANLKS